MYALNTLILEGTVFNDVEINNTGMPVSRITIETKSEYKDSNSQEMSCYEIVCYGNLAEFVKDKVKKGDGIRVTGRIKQERWNENGRMKSKIVVVASVVEYVKQLCKKDV